MVSSAVSLQEFVFEATSTASAVQSSGSNSPVGMDRLCLTTSAFQPEKFEGTSEPSTRPVTPRRDARVASHAKPSGLFVATGKWEGIVESVDDMANEFDVRMADILHSGDELFMTFSKDDVSPEDALLVVPGAVFYWVVGYYDRVSGQRTRVAELKFRRLPVRRARDLARARERARRTLLELGL